MVLFSILIVFVFFFYAFSMIVKWIFNRKIKKLERQMGHDYNDNEPRKKNERSNPHINPNIGEYTDFEEIE